MGSKSNQDLVGIDVFGLDDEQLRNHISELQNERLRLKKTTVPSVTECDRLIAIAHSEVSSRASSKLATTAICIAVGSILLTLGLAIFRLIGEHHG